MNILVTGGNGQLGRSIEKISVDFPQHSFTFTDLPELDITDSGSISAMIEKHDAGLIINCAAYTAVDKAESDPVLAEMINVRGADRLAEAAFNRGIKLIHISTDYVFSGDGNKPLREDDKTGPTGVYGRTKLAGEKRASGWGCDGAVIRTAWLYSEFGNNFVKTMLRLGGERGELNVVYDQTGTPTYAPDLARAIMAIAEGGLEGFETYHFSNEGVASWYDFAKEIFSQAGMDIKVNPIETSQYPTPAQRPAYSVLAKDKIKAAGAEVPYWKDSLGTCLNELKKQK